jgi:hypothetical protein
LVVDLDPEERQKGIVLQAEALLQEIANVHPAVVLLTGESHPVGHLACPEIANAQRTAQPERESNPCPTGGN